MAMRMDDLSYESSFSDEVQGNLEEIFGSNEEDFGILTKKNNGGKDENKFKWTFQNTKLMLTYRFKREKKFATPNCKKIKLWNSLALDMFAKHGYKVSGNECDQKFRNMMQTYKKNKEKQKKSGEGTITWIFFELFDNFYHKKPCINPPKEIIGTTTIPVEETEIEINSDIENEYGSKKKLKRIDWKQKYFEDKMKAKKEDTKRKETQWTEQKELERERTAALLELTKALSEHNKIKLREVSQNLH